MKVIIAGSRDFNDYDLLSESCDRILNTITPIKIVSGTCNGADKLGERYAYDKSYSVMQFPANWNKDGKSAGYIRNKRMAEYADALIAFWDGKSKGTKLMIDLAKEHKLKLAIIRY